MTNWNQKLMAAARAYIATMRPERVNHQCQWFQDIVSNGEANMTMRNCPELVNERTDSLQSFKIALANGGSPDQPMKTSQDTLFQHLNAMDMWELVLAAIPYIDFSTPPMYPDRSNAFPYLLWLYLYRNEKMTPERQFRASHGGFGIPMRVYEVAYAYATDAQKQDIVDYENGKRDWVYPVLQDHSPREVANMMNEKKHILEKYRK